MLALEKPGLTILTSCCSTRLLAAHRIKRAWKAVICSASSFNFHSLLNISLQQLVEAVEADKVRSIGVSNRGVHHLNELKHNIGESEAAL